MLKKLFLGLTVIFLITIIPFSFVRGEENTVKIYDKTISKENQYIKINATIPEIETANKNIGDELSKKIKDRFESTVVDITDLAEVTKEEQNNKFIQKYEINTIYEVPYNKNNILSLYTLNYQFTGGAHGMTTLVPYNLNIKTGEEIQLNTLFKKDFNYKEFINNEVKKEIAKNPNMYYQNEENKFKTISDKQDFCISDNGLIIVFQLYDIGPYSSGIQQILIPKDEILNNLSQRIW